MTLMNATVKTVKNGAVPMFGILTYFLAPAVDSAHAPSTFATFFSTTAQLLGTFLIALALLSSLPALEHLRFRQTMGGISLLYLGLGLVAATAGTVDRWSCWVYRWLFAITAGAMLGTLLVLVMLGAFNIWSARTTAVAKRADELG